MEIRFIKDGEAKQCNDFHNRLYQTDRTLKQWHWVFLQNSFDANHPLYIVAVDNDKIVGTQTFIPIKMIDEKGIFWTAKSEGTLVDPAYRGKQIFKKMYDIFFDYANENKFAYIWGFTTATKALERIGFEILFKTTQLFLPFSSRAVSMLGKTGESAPKTYLYKIAIGAASRFSSLKLTIKKPNLRSDLKIIAHDTPPEGTGKLCEKFIQQYGGKTIYRDKDYFNWRIYQNPYAKGIFKGLYLSGEMVGWVVYSIGDDGMGYLVDILAVEDAQKKYSPEYFLKLLLHDAVIGTRNMGATGIRGWHVTDHPFDKLLKKVASSLGFYHINQGHATIIYSSESAPERPSHDNFNEWYISRIFTEGVLG